MSPNDINIYIYVTPTKMYKLAMIKSSRFQLFNSLLSNRLIVRFHATEK